MDPSTLQSCSATDSTQPPMPHSLPQASDDSASSPQTRSCPSSTAAPQPSTPAALTALLVTLLEQQRHDREQQRHDREQERHDREQERHDREQEREERAREKERQREDREDHRKLIAAVLERLSVAASASAFIAPAEGSLIRSQIAFSAPPRFDGEDSARFPDFYDALTIRIEKAQLSPEDKFAALQGALTGRALKKLGTLQATHPRAYERAREILEVNYGDPDSQSHSCFHRLRCLHELLGSGEDPDVEDYADELRLICGQLEGLGITHETLDSHVILLLGHFPVSLRKKMEMERDLRDLKPTPKMSEFQAYLDKVSRKARKDRQEHRVRSQPHALANFPSLPFANASLLAAGQKAEKKPLRHPSYPACGQSANRSTASALPPCPYCDQTDHQSFSCPSDRLSTVRKKRLCYNCLQLGHGCKFCNSGKNCLKCGRRHHTSLHEAIEDKYRKSVSSAPAPRTTTNLVSSTQPVALAPTIMATFTAIASNSVTGKSVVCNVLLDSGSSHSHINASKAHELGLRSEKSLQLSTSVCHSSSRQRVKADLVSFHLQAKDGSRWPIRALAVDDLAAPITLPAVKLPQDITGLLKGATFGVANLPPESDQEFPIDVILGNDVCQALTGPSVQSLRLGSTLSAHMTHFGAILTGSVGMEMSEPACSHLASSKLLRHGHDAPVGPDYQLKSPPAPRSSKQPLVPERKKKKIRKPSSLFSSQEQFQNPFRTSVLVSSAPIIPASRVSRHLPSSSPRSSPLHPAPCLLSSPQHRPYSPTPHPPPSLGPSLSLPQPASSRRPSSASLARRRASPPPPRTLNVAASPEEPTQVTHSNSAQLS